LNYGAEVLTLFHEAAHAGQVEGGASGRGRGRTGGVEVVFSAGVAGGRIARMRYGALGCPWVIAACEWACRQVEGGRVAGLGAVDAAAMAAALAAPAEKTGSLLVVEDALAELGRALAAGVDCDDRRIGQQS
jgi:NifU-like protein involved in Fe-S cluster formation